MTLTLQLDRDEELALQKKTQAAGMDVNAFALRVLRSAAQRPSLDEVLAPARAKFVQSGMTEEQLAERYEAQKHAERAARRGKPFDE